MEFWVWSEIGKGKSHNFILVRFEIGLGFSEVGCTTPPKFPGSNPDMSGNPQAILMIIIMDQDERFLT